MPAWPWIRQNSSSDTSACLGGFNRRLTSSRALRLAAKRVHKRSELETFIKNLCGREMPIEEFDAMIWMSRVKGVTVEVDGSMRFTFVNEKEVVI